MMTAEWIFGWWNLVFLAPFAVALLYLFVYAVSGVTFGDADHDAEVGHDVEADADVDHDMEVDHDVEADVHADVDAEADVDADADVDHDIDADSDVDADADHDAEGDGDQGSGSSSSIFAAMTWLGIGRVPVSIVLLVLLLSWGVIGFCSNQALRERIADPAKIGLISIAIAAVGSAAGDAGGDAAGRQGAARRRDVCRAAARAARRGRAGGLPDQASSGLVADARRARAPFPGAGADARRGRGNRRRAPACGWSRTRRRTGFFTWYKTRPPTETRRRGQSQLSGRQTKRGIRP